MTRHPLASVCTRKEDQCTRKEEQRTRKEAQIPSLLFLLIFAIEMTLLTSVPM
jgi:hypothetical protein